MQHAVARDHHCADRHVERVKHVLRLALSVGLGARICIPPWTGDVGERGRLPRPPRSAHQADMKKSYHT